MRDLEAYYHVVVGFLGSACGMLFLTALLQIKLGSHLKKRGFSIGQCVSFYKYPVDPCAKSDGISAATDAFAAIHRAAPWVLGGGVSIAAVGVILSACFGPANGLFGIVLGAVCGVGAAATATSACYYALLIVRR